MKIFCIGRNYADHAKEMNSPIPKQPMVFMKPYTALLRKNKPFYYPEFSNEIHYEIELVIKICKNGKYVQPRYAHEYYDEIALGIDFTARDLQRQCKEKGHPWEIAKGFDRSAALSEFIPISELDNADISFGLQKNDKLVQSGSTSDMIFDFTSLICHLSKYFTLQMGDMIYTGTPSGVGPVSIGDRLNGFINNRSMLRCEIK